MALSDPYSFFDDEAAAPFVSGKSVDRLGSLKAKIAKLQSEYDELASALREEGPGEYPGARFIAIVSEPCEVEQFDVAKAKKKLLSLGVSERWLKANVKIVKRRSAVSIEEFVS